MKLMICVALAAVAVVLVHADFVAYLKELQGHRSFQRLSTDDKLLFTELVMAAETNTTEEFIDRVGLLSVLNLIDRMSFADASVFSAYLADHLGYHHHRPTNTDDITKRDIEKRDRGDHDDHFFGHMNNHANYYNSHLNDAEKQLWDQLKQHASTNTVTAFIDQVGYGAVFGLIENMSITEANAFLHMLEAQLQKEAGATTVVKRQWSWSNFGGSEYTSNLNDYERKVYREILEAAQNDRLTEYIDQVGYGVVFGVLENASYSGNNYLLDLMEKQLAKEANMAATTN